MDSGSLHHIENVGADVAEFIIAFRSERPEDFGLGAAFGTMTDAVPATPTISSRTSALGSRMVARVIAVYGRTSDDERPEHTGQARPWRHCLP